MKTKILLLTALCFCLLNCEISTQKTKSDYPIGSSTGGNCISYSEKDLSIEGMNYHVWYLTGGISEKGYCVFVINTTKDSLECEVFRKQLNKK